MAPPWLTASTLSPRYRSAIRLDLLTHAADHLGASSPPGTVAARSPAANA